MTTDDDVQRGAGRQELDRPGRDISEAASLPQRHKSTQGMMAMLELRGVRKIAEIGSAWALGLLLAALLTAAGPVQAEPYMAVREGYKCSKCHVNQTGGGMRTDYARVYMGTRNAMWPGLKDSGAGAPSMDLGSGRLKRSSM